MKGLAITAGLVALLAGLAGSADARVENGNRQPKVLVFTVQNLGTASCPAPPFLFGLSFDMASPAGGQLGSGVSCVQSVDPPEGCASAGCRDTVHAIFTLSFRGGTLTAAMVLHEKHLTDATVLQVDHGTITSGTGDFAGARGSIGCAGTVTFTPTSVIPKLACVVHVT
jgi:hypothetical protein